MNGSLSSLGWRTPSPVLYKCIVRDCDRRTRFAKSRCEFHQRPLFGREFKDCPSCRTGYGTGRRPLGAVERPIGRTRAVLDVCNRCGGSGRVPA